MTPPLRYPRVPLPAGRLGLRARNFGGSLPCLAATLLLAACDGPPPVQAVCDAAAPAYAEMGERGTRPPTAPAHLYPFTGSHLVRYAGNPVIEGSDISPNHTLVADPFLLVANDRLYAFFEALHDPAPLDGCCGEIWMAESGDGFTWEGVRKVSSGKTHFSHPHAFIDGGRIHLFYNYSKTGGIFHRSSSLEEFPEWSREREVFRGSDHGWHHLVEFVILQQGDGWHFLGITGDGTLEDQWIRGRWAPTLPEDWGTGSREMTPCPLLDVDHHDWVKGIVEITPVTVNDRLFLKMGTTRESDGKRAIGTFAVSELSPTAFTGAWVRDDFTFPLGESGWDEWDIHRAHAVVFKDQWIYMYDGRRSDGIWKLGVASAPVARPEPTGRSPESVRAGSMPDAPTPSASARTSASGTE